MRLYRITWKIKTQTGNPATTVIVPHQVWAGTQTQSAAIRGGVRQKHGYVPNSVDTEAVDVPIDKKGLLKFLNTEIEGIDY